VRFASWAAKMLLSLQAGFVKIRIEASLQKFVFSSQERNSRVDLLFEGRQDVTGNVHSSSIGKWRALRVTSVLPLAIAVTAITASTSPVP
jgi:hypothetical protein